MYFPLGLNNLSIRNSTEHAGARNALLILRVDQLLAFVARTA